MRHPEGFNSWIHKRAARQAFHRIRRARGSAPRQAKADPSSNHKAAPDRFGILVLNDPPLASAARTRGIKERVGRLERWEDLERERSGLVAIVNIHL